jgi:para-nitrobenzyl esterase
MERTLTGIDRRTLLAAGVAAGVVTAGAVPAAAADRGRKRLASAVDGADISTPATEIVETAEGKIRGYISGQIHTFKGIPYARTTAGANRFRAPQRPEPWTGIYPALAWGAVCPQGPNPQANAPEFKWLLEYDTGFPGENCLCLNVWSPALRDNRKRPVMVWFHGGGFASGSAQEFPCYDGEALARRGDVVVVSVNHRLNLFGFLNLSAVGGEAYEGSGVAGMLDLVAALEWVRDNIAEFGGDPANVTIFGQSGGGAKVTNLMAMPAARGLFHKAITQSGGSFMRENNREQSERLGRDVVAELGLTSASLARIHELSVHDLQQSLERVVARSRKVSPIGLPAAFVGGPAPLIDDSHILSGEGVPSFSTNIPFLFGGTSQEMALTLFEPDLEEIDEAAMIARVDKMFPGRGASIVETYRLDFPQEKPVDILLRAASYGFTGRSIIRTSELLTAPGARTAPAYRFLFDWRTPALDGRPRAKHNSDIAFAFNNVDKSNPSAAGGDAAVDLGHRMSDAWSSFARNGSPSHPGLPNWKPISATHWPTMIFDTPCRSDDLAHSAERRAFADAGTR